MHMPASSALSHQFPVGIFPISHSKKKFYILDCKKLLWSQDSNYIQNFEIKTIHFLLTFKIVCLVN